MYHIWPAQCQIQLGAGKCVDHRDFPRFFGCLAAQRGIQLALAVVAGIGGVDQRQDVVPADRRLDLGKAG